MRLGKFIIILMFLSASFLARAQELAKEPPQDKPKQVEEKQTKKVKKVKKEKRGEQEPKSENALKVANEVVVESPPPEKLRFVPFLGLGYSSWREPLTIHSTSSLKGVSSFNGFYVRYELLRPKVGLDWGLAGLLFAGGADAKSADSSSYLVNKVPVAAATLSPLIYFKLESDVFLKAALDVTFKTLNWPKAGGVTGASSSGLTVGPVLGLSYRINKNWMIDQKMGSYAISGDIVWQVGLSYRL